MTEKRFYVYVHRRLADGSIFYIGKGHGSRMTSLSGRNHEWREVAKLGWYGEKTASFQSEKCALSIEAAMIRFIGKQNLCNRSNGGTPGPTGMVHTEETKEKFRVAKIGKRQSEDHAQKSRTNKLGKKISDTSRFNLEKRKPVGNSLGEIFPSAAEAARQVSIRLGVNASQGNITMAILGHRKTAYGMGWHHAPD